MMFRRGLLFLWLGFCVAGCGVPQADLPLPAKLERVVSLAPNITEIIFLLNAEAKLVGVTNDCNYPDSRVLYRIPRTGPFGTPQLERIVAAQPQLVLYTDLADLTLLEKLNQLKIPTRRVSIQSFLELNAAIADLGQLLGQKKLSWKMIRENQEKMVQLNRVAAEIPPVKVFVELWDSPLLSASSQSFIHEIVSMAGGINLIRDKLNPHVQVEVESLLSANPEFILKLHPRPSVVTRYPSLRGLAVYQQGRIYTPRNLDIYLRPGPRMLLAAEELQQVLKSLRPFKP